MRKSNKKLALKKESLRNLSEAELSSVGGGTYVMYVDYNRYVLKQPVSLTSKTDTFGGYNLLVLSHVEVQKEAGPQARVAAQPERRPARSGRRRHLSLRHPERRLAVGHPEGARGRHDLAHGRLRFPDRLLGLVAVTDRR